jgi:hypothetical protein
MKKTILWALMLLLILPKLSLSTIVLMPELYTSIQDVINNLNDGDSILVGPGVYEESIILWGKSIALIGREGPYYTVIRSPSSEFATVSLSNGMIDRTIFKGFTSGEI